LFAAHHLGQVVNGRKRQVWLGMTDLDFVTDIDIDKNYLIDGFEAPVMLIF